MALRVGIDVGGTFTDLFLYDTNAGKFFLAKTPSTPLDQSIGVLKGIHQLCERVGVNGAELTAIYHGMTVATNAVLEGKGARVGLLVTQGWRTILHLAESWTPGPLFGFFSYIKPEPLVALEDTREVAERLSSRGAVVLDLDEAQALRQIADLLDTGVEALTICLFNAYANSAHERRLKELAIQVLEQRGCPALPVSTSSEVSPEFREYERTVTTVMNSYVGPVMSRYLTNLEQKLVQDEISAPLQVVRSDGGVMSLDAARAFPVQTVLSGPSGGVNGAAFIATRAGFDRIMTFDMGGTSTDVAVCVDGMPAITRETRVGSFPVRAPSVDVASIGAGGGSIADVSEVTEALRVGPASAGADPGPACYGRGGVAPTVTDANVVLGHLPPTLLGGAMTLDSALAHKAVSTIAQLLGTTVYAAAEGIIDIVNESMLGALRVVTVQKGLNPKDFALVAFGGAGGLHANALAAALGCFPVIIPPEPGVLSALGFIVADVRNEFSQSFIRTSTTTTIEELGGILGRLEARAREWLVVEGVEKIDQELFYLLDMRYYHQGYEIPMEVPVTRFTTMSVEDLVGLFRAEHERLYGFSLPGAVEFVNLRARAIGRVAKPSLEQRPMGDGDPTPALTGTHPAWVAGAVRDVPLYDRTLLRPGMRLSGQAIVTQYDATTLILPGHIATVDPWLNLLIEEA